MIFGSLCSGIEAASVAWNPLGWKCAFLSEIAPFPRALLKHHYPGWAFSCECSDRSMQPCTVLDPFGGSGTTAQVAAELGRFAVMIDLNPANADLMAQRLAGRKRARQLDML